MSSNSFQKMNASLKSAQGVTWELYDSPQGKRVNILLVKGDAYSRDWWVSYPVAEAGRPAELFRIPHPDRILQDWFAACDAAGVRRCVAHSYSPYLSAPCDFVVPWKSSARDYERIAQ